ncbi:MAG: sulfotransferase [Planctomycetes bacterium]|nr:sulfotransferase [Planctomycetota bacterium]
MKVKIPVFIGGCSRSGTTFLGSLLGAHERCLCTPESHFIIKYILNQVNCSGYYDDYQKLFFDITHDFRFQIWETKLPFESINQCNFSEIVQNILNLYNVKIEKHHAETWVDHTPWNLMFADILLDHFPAAKFIHIIRDGRAIVASVKRKRWGDSSPIHLAATWINNLAHGFAAENLLSDKIIRVKYEDLVTSTENELKRICNFIGITFSERMLMGDGFHVPDYTKEQHMLVGKPAQSDRIDGWKKELSTKEIEIFEYYAGRMLSMLDYDTLNKNPKMPSFMKRLSLKIKDRLKSLKDNVYRNKKKSILRNKLLHQIS